MVSIYLRTDIGCRLHVTMVHEHGEGLERFITARKHKINHNMHLQKGGWLFQPASDALKYAR